jgi:hypothetical protein
LTQKEIKYLGVPKKFENYFGLINMNFFTLMDIQADLVIVEFLNVYCHSCEAQAPVMNKVYELIQKDEKLREKVKMIGVCSGNSLREIKKFKEKKAIPFPLIPDLKFDAYEAIGEPCGTPFILLVRKGKEQGIITWSHIGVISTPLYFVQEAWDALNTDLNTIIADAKQRSSMKVIMKKPKPYIPDEVMEKKIRSTMELHRMKLIDLKKTRLSNDQDIYVGKVIEEGGARFFFSKLISRNPVCDICHAVHFILTFDDRGIVVDFVPVHITKYGNIEWTNEEIRKTREKLIGKSILKPIAFDPEVDAVSHATMTSALIFNSVERTGKDYGDLQEKGYIKNDVSQ